MLQKGSAALSFGYSKPRFLAVGLAVGKAERTGKRQIISGQGHFLC
jgi:hypothetical protein